jgi:D-alanine-D-alanine ligase
MQQVFFSNRRFESLKRLKIGVLCGGNSSERVISRRSGRAVHNALKRVGIASRRLDPAKSLGRRLLDSLRDIDVAFVAMHGKGGEDGQLQDILEHSKVPYVGSNPLGCRRSFDKKIAKSLFVKNGIPTASYITVKSRKDFNRLAKFPAPFFVKPVSEGSSIGVFPVEDFESSIAEIGQALETHGELLIEKKIIGREFTVGILGRKALPVVEVRPKREFYDYRAKYTKGMTDYLTPAPIPESLAKRLQKIALKAHQSLGLRDLSRVDIMVDLEGNPFVLEINAIPGFTELSLLPKAARSNGISFEDLCCRLLDWAHRRKTSRLVLKESSRNGKKKKS